MLIKVGQSVKIRGHCRSVDHLATAGAGKNPIRPACANICREGRFFAIFRSAVSTHHRSSVPSSSIHSSSLRLPVPNLSLICTTVWMPSKNAPKPLCQVLGQDCCLPTASCRLSCVETGFVGQRVTYQSRLNVIDLGRLFYQTFGSDHFGHARRRDSMIGENGLAKGPCGVSDNGLLTMQQPPALGARWPEIEVL